MANTSDDTRTGKSRAGLYEEITSHIVADLERGTVPWVRPWGRGENTSPLGLPRNAATGKSYSGINILILWGAVFEGGFSSQEWLTFRQAKAIGGTVRNGERGVTVCYADRFVPKTARDTPRDDRTTDEPEAIPFLRRYTVFNVAQCDGLPDCCFGSPLLISERQIIPQAEALMQATGAVIRIGGDCACYCPSDDVIQLPPQPAFFDQINYYRTLFHELGHWTGHASRLARDLSGSFGSKPYAREELVAEIATAFMCASLAIVPTVRHADYLGSWLAVLREDNRAIFRAASKASKAADYILAFHPGNLSKGHALPNTGAAR